MMGALLFGELVWGSPEWLYPGLALLALGTVVLLWAYRSTARGGLLRGLAPGLKFLALAGTAVILLEPLLYGTRPRPGANLFLVLVDNSASLQIHDPGASSSRGEQLAPILKQDAAWQVRLGQDFDVRRYAFDSRLRAVTDFDQLKFDGPASRIGEALRTVQQRFESRPVAGILLVTDGNPTDAFPEAFTEGHPPIYPVVVGAASGPRDLRIERVVTSQANFRAAPVTVTAMIGSDRMEGEAIVVELLSESGEVLEKRSLSANDRQAIPVSFRTRPAAPGLAFYEVRAYLAAAPLEDAKKAASTEATLANNHRLTMIDLGEGPYRVLYVGGRPNWEFKFLRRALETDPEIQMTALVRIAKREPKFDFRGRAGESSNPLFKGFDNQDPEEVEQYDQPVLLRLNVENAEQLRTGFPQSAEELYAYDAIVLDDLEAEFFTGDQMSLVQRFVSQRGGGLMMLGGQESFIDGGYHRTPIGDLLPVYVAPVRTETAKPERIAPGRWRLELTREGVLQPWVRVRETLEEEEQRLASMPAQKTVNAVSGLKPGATVLLNAKSAGHEPRPALVAQNFGRGRTAALLVADLWRWGLARQHDARYDDFDHQWQQMIRWLVADVPRRVMVDVEGANEPGQPIEIRVRVRDEVYQPLDNAHVELNVHTPDEQHIPLTAHPSAEAAGLYVATFVARDAGRYRADIQVTGPSGEEFPKRTTGWVAEPSAQEFASLTPNREQLRRIAEASGGELVEMDELDQFARSLASRKVPVVEPWISPLWHRWPVLGLVLCCLVGEWALRRWRGLP